MAQSSLQMPTTGTISGLAFAQLLNNHFAALATKNSGASEPADKFPLMDWVDTSADPAVWNIRNAANTAWIAIATISSSGDFTPLIADAALAAAFELITTLPGETTPALADELAIYDVSQSGSKRRKATIGNVLKAVALLSAVGTPNLSHKLLGHDGTSAVYYTPQLLFNLINALTAIGTISKSDKLAFFDADGGAAGAMAFEDAMSGLIADLTEVTTPADADWVLLRQAGGGVRKVKKSNIAGGANLTLLGTVDADSGGSAVITDLPASKALLLVFRDVRVGGAGRSIRVDLSSTNGVSYGASRQITTDQATGNAGNSGQVWITNTGVTSTNKTLSPMVVDHESDGGLYAISVTENSVTGIINALRFTPSSGNFSGGVGAIEVYGLK